MSSFSTISTSIVILLNEIRMMILPNIVYYHTYSPPNNCFLKSFGKYGTFAGFCANAPLKWSLINSKNLFFSAFDICVIDISLKKLVIKQLPYNIRDGQPPRNDEYSNHNNKKNKQISNIIIECKKRLSMSTYIYD